MSINFLKNDRNDGLSFLRDVIPRLQLLWGSDVAIDQQTL